jgi:hypothetical protein
MAINCEGYEIAYSQIDSTCEECRVSAQCKTVTNRKLLTAKLKGEEPMEKTLTKEQLAGLLEAANLKKEVAMINKKFAIGCALVKGMTIEEAKELILETAFPTPPPEEEDGFELEDDDTGSDEFDDFEDSDSVEADTAADTKEADITADDDLEGLEDADLDDNPDSDETATTSAITPNMPEDDDTATTSGGTPVDESPDIPEGMDEEEYDSLIGRISNMEKRLDDIYQILAASKTGKKAAAAAGSDVADEGEKLKADMPYSEEDLGKMNAKIIKKLCKAIGINSFQKKVADLLPQILEYQDANCK